MHTTMHVGIHVVVFLRHSLYDLTGLLRRRSIVEIDQGVLPVNDLTQDGESTSPFLFPCWETIYLHSLHPSHLLNSPLKRLSTKT